jgi:hypothetical protein
MPGFLKVIWPVSGLMKTESFAQYPSRFTVQSINRQPTMHLYGRSQGIKEFGLLADNTATYTQDDATRAYSAEEMPKIFKAMAVISRTALGKAASHLFLYFHGESVPIKNFDNEKEAREWLKQFLQEPE